MNHPWKLDLFMKKKILTKMKVAIIYLVVVISFFSCMQEKKKNMTSSESNHYLEIRERGVGMISLDKVPNTMVMKKSEYGNSAFFSYQVSFLDSSLITDPKKQLDINKYYLYDMYKDWVALVNGDSVRPVFFQPGIKKTSQVNDGVIVFEMPRGIEPDTLLYLDSYGAWGTHQLFLNK
jgi:hypothetical protein